MPITSTIGNVYAYNGTVAGLQLGGLININLVNFAGGPLTATFIDNNGELTVADNGATTAAIGTGAAAPITYLGSGWSATAMLLGLPVAPRPVMAFSVGGQIYLYFPEGTPPLAVLSIAFKINPATGFILPNQIVLCFAEGTRILTPQGEVAVETLAPGDLVLTADRGPQPLRQVRRREVSAKEIARRPELQPIRIRRGALGQDLPRRRLVVSRQHRILVAPAPCGGDALLAATHLAALPGVDLMPAQNGICYIHLLFDRHEIVLAEGLAAESLFLGPRALKTMPPTEQDGPTDGASHAGMAPARPFLYGHDLRRFPGGATALRGLGWGDLFPDGALHTPA